MSIPNSETAGESRKPRAKVHTYRNEHGLKVFERVRFYTDSGKKMVTYRHGIGRGWAMGGEYDPVLIKEKPEGADALLYRLPQVLKEIGRGAAGEVWWTEGETDADALVLFQGVCATSHHQAAGNAASEQARWFEGFRGWVMLCGDDDPAGYVCVIRRLEMLERLGVRAMVLLPQEGKDVRDHLNAGYDLDDLVLYDGEDLRELREKAARTPVGVLRGYLDPEGAAKEAEIVRLLEETGWRVKIQAAEPEWVMEQKRWAEENPELAERARRIEAARIRVNREFGIRYRPSRGRYGPVKGNG